MKWRTELNIEKCTLENCTRWGSKRKGSIECNAPELSVPPSPHHFPERSRYSPFLLSQGKLSWSQGRWVTLLKEGERARKRKVQLDSLWFRCVACISSFRFNLSVPFAQLFPYASCSSSFLLLIFSSFLSSLVSLLLHPWQISFLLYHIFSAILKLPSRVSSRRRRWFVTFFLEVYTGQ